MLNSLYKPNQSGWCLSRADRACVCGQVKDIDMQNCYLQVMCKSEKERVLFDFSCTQFISTVYLVLTLAGSRLCPSYSHRVASFTLSSPINFNSTRIALALGEVAEPDPGIKTE